MATRSRRRRSRPPTVLIVEDDADVRVLAKSIIGDDGYQTLSAASGREALALLEQQGVAVAILFTDINLPDGLDGVELAGRVIELRPGLPVIYTTGGRQTDGLDALFVEGAIFLPKPYTRDQLLAALKQQIGGAPQGGN